MTPAQPPAGLFMSGEPTVAVEASPDRRTHEILDKIRVSVGAVAVFSMVGLLVWTFSGGQTQAAPQLPAPALAYAYPGMPYRPLPSQQMRGAYPAPVAVVPAGQNPTQYLPVPAMTEGAKPSGRSSTVVMAIKGAKPSGPSMADLNKQLEADDMWWGDKEYPPSKVLGIGQKVPSAVFGVLSGIAFAIGVYSIAQSNLLNILSGSTVNGWYVAGALLVPYSWGLHVASWIQKQNGK